MFKLTSKITTPIILVGLFSIVVLISLNLNQLEPSFYIVLLLLVVYIFLFGLAIGQSLASPIRELLNKALELSRGNFSTRVYLQTKDELTELANALNKIAEELEETHIEREITEKTVEIKARARTEALEEIINALEQKVKNRTLELERIMTESKILQEQVKQKEIEINQLKKTISDLDLKLKKKTAQKPTG